MSTFFRQTAQAMIAKHIDRFPLLKLDQVIDWQPIEQYLNRQKTRYLRDHRGRPASAVVHVQSRPARTMAQPLRSRTRTQPHYPHR
ncbi:putative iSNme1 transposase, partial [Neisseria meningitidis 2002004]